MCETFVSEPLEPIKGAFDAVAMASGEPGLPRGFRWRGQRYDIAVVRRQWKESQPEGGVGRPYLRKHWYELDMTDGCHMTVYFERQARSKSSAKARWWLYTVAGQPPGTDTSQ